MTVRNVWRKVTVARPFGGYRHATQAADPSLIGIYGSAEIEKFILRETPAIAADCIVQATIVFDALDFHFEPPITNPTNPPAA